MTAPTPRRARRRRHVVLGALLLLAPGFAGATTAATATAGVAATSAQAAPYPVVPFHPRGSDDARLVKAWNAWVGRDHQHYTTVVARFCGCEPEPRLSTRVEDGQVTSVRYLHTADELDRRGYEMDELYRVLRAAYQEADDVTVRYLSGVPVSISVVYGARPSDRDTSMSVRVRRTDEAAEFAYPITPFRLRSEDRRALKDSWRAWRASEISSYDVTTARRDGEGVARTLRTRVDDTVVRSVVAVGAATGVPEPTRGYEVERLYRTIRSLQRTADSVHVRYDARGVPRRISADPDDDVVDDELVLRVRLRAS